MRGLKMLRASILACLLSAGLGACLGERIPPPPTASQPPPSSMEAAPTEESTDTDKTLDLASAPLPEPPFTSQDSDGEVATDTSSCLEAKTAKTPAAGQADKGCYKLIPGGGAKYQGRRNGRCEPQSLPYARCRSGIRSCNNGYENGPLTWFACEKKAGKTSSEAKAGTVLILAANSRRKMSTGHVMYVEGVSPLSPTTCRLSLSHTNYDRKCSKETKIEAIYDRKAMTIDIHSGAWKAWGQNLKVAGFILR